MVESPLFPLEKPNLCLSAEEERIANDLHLNGFAVFEFPDSAFESRITRIKSDLGPRFGVDFEDVEADKTSGERRIQDAWRFQHDVKALATNPVVIALLSKLWGRQAFPFQTLNFAVGTQQAAHSDSVHFSSMPERFMCGVWVAFEDVSPDAGPLFYYPGSHRWPLMTNALIGKRGFGEELDSAQTPFSEAWDAIIEATGTHPEFFQAKKGQALIWCANLLHGGGVQHDPRLTRWSQVTHYYFEDCIYYTPAFSDESLGKIQERSPVSISDDIVRYSSYQGEELSRNTDKRSKKLFGRIKNLFR